MQMTCLTTNQKVGGSSPFRRTKLKATFKAIWMWL